ncbi:MAG: glycoside hydrolase family 3 C-terminal domain-containing protein [Thermomicrobiales bacterium]|nr:glycoside hydrolase family 3 C-terminal domain-containing protein [Thermomicrobiales bacterium]
MSDFSEKIDSLIPQLTLEEKANLTVGRDMWSTYPVERLGIPSVVMTDGPTGVRMAASSGENIGHSIPATCFPTASGLASSWNRDLLSEVGRTIGIEAQALGVQTLLGPGLNQKRSPLGGRNFEYLSEDPVLAGELAAAFVNGIQGEGVGACPKHYVANESETNRMFSDAIIDERVLRENYLHAFEVAVKKSAPWTIMESYNKVNGEYVAENKRLLHDILKEEWGFDGIVISDWSAVNDRVGGIRAGLHLQMPTAPTAWRVVEAVNNGALDEARLDEIVRDLLHYVFTADAAKKSDVTFSEDEHHRIARAAAAESITLLQNDGDLLPLSPSAQVAVIGEFARKPRYQGGGSSEVNPTRVEVLYDELSAAYGNDLPYAAGYHGEETSDELLAEAVETAKAADIAVVVIGLPDSYETEGRDRSHIDLPDAHNTLVSRVHEVQPNTVVVLINGSAVDLSWVSYVPAIVEGWLTGQGSGGAIADVLTGTVNPSGKLAESFPWRIEDTPTYTSFWPDAHGVIPFSEGVFYGYRWYDTRDIEPHFPFGHGLSYTTFEYSDLELSTDTYTEGEPLEVRVTITNTGDRVGKEVVQLYLHEHQSRFPRAVRELKDFAKVELAPGESKVVTFSLDGTAFAQWDTAVPSWVVNPGTFDVIVGASSRDLRLETSLEVISTSLPKKVYTRETPLGDFMKIPAIEAIVRDQFRQRMGDGPLMEMILLFVISTPIGKMAYNGQITEEQLQGMIALANGS